MDYSMYDTLLQFPLFRGISEQDFNNILQKVKLEFCRYDEGTNIISAGDECNSFIFLLSGKVLSSRYSEEGSFTYEEVLDAPYLLEPYSLFGISTKYTRSYSTLSNISILKIDKQYVYSEFHKYNICRMNLLNMLSSRAQSLDKFIWSRKELSLPDRMTRFVLGLSETPTGEKHLQIKMNDFATLLDTTRINISKELNRLEAEGKLELRRKAIIIPALEKLYIYNLSR